MTDSVRRESAVLCFLSSVMMLVTVCLSAYIKVRMSFALRFRETAMERGYFEMKPRQKSISTALLPKSEVES
jgi:hypothetical protein